MRRAALRAKIAIAVLFIVLSSVIMTFGESYRFQDGDSLLMPVMSIVKPTWFYWNQDRFGNLLPILFSPIRDISLNFYAQLVLRKICAFLSIFFMLSIVGDRDLWLERFFASVIVIFITATGFVGEFFNAALPQPISCAVFVLGMWSLSPGWADRRIAWLAAAIAFWTAFYVNLSLAVLVVPLSLGTAIMCRGRMEPIGHRAAWSAILAAAMGAFVFSRFFEPHTPTTLLWSWDGLNAATVAMLSGINLTSFFGLLFLVGMGLSILVRWAPKQPMTVVAVTGHHARVIAVLAAGAVFFAATTWVQINGMAARYFTVQSLFVLVFPASLAVSMIRDSGPPPWYGPRARRCCQAGLLVVAALTVLVRSGPPAKIAFKSDSPDHPLAINADVPSVMHLVPGAGPLVITGDYWLAIPMVYNRMALHPEAVTYAVTDHWEPMRGALHDLLAPGREVTLVCLPPHTENCVPHVAQWIDLDSPSSIPTVLFGRVLADAPLESGGRFRVMTLHAGGEPQPTLRD